MLGASVLPPARPTPPNLETGWGATRKGGKNDGGVLGGGHRGTGALAHLPSSH